MQLHQEYTDACQSAVGTPSQALDVAALCERLRCEKLRDFAEALESGNYGDLCF